MRNNVCDIGDVSPPTLHLNTVCAECGCVCFTLQVPEDTLGLSMTRRSVQTKIETVTKPLNAAQAADCRDALVKVSNAPLNLCQCTAMVKSQSGEKS